jgi:hypothetical protein
MTFRASSDYGLRLRFRLLVLLGPDRYPGVMDIYSTFFEVGRRKGSLKERSVTESQSGFYIGGEPWHLPLRPGAVARMVMTFFILMYRHFPPSHG